MTQAKNRSRRRLVNMFIDPRMQIMLFLPYVVTLVGFVITNMINMKFTIRSFSQMALDPDAATMMDLGEVYRRLLVISSIGLVVAAVVGFVAVVTVSHRILGPLYNIQRHVRRLRDGEYHHDLVLRRGDRLQGFAEDLRAVTTTLRASAAKTEPKS